MVCTLFVNIPKFNDWLFVKNVEIFFWTDKTVTVTNMTHYFYYYTAGRLDTGHRRRRCRHNHFVIIDPTVSHSVIHSILS